MLMRVRAGEGRGEEPGCATGGRLGKLSKSLISIYFTILPYSVCVELCHFFTQAYAQEFVVVCLSTYEVKKIK